VRRPTLTASARDGASEVRVGTKKRALRSNKETDEGQRFAALVNSLTKNAPYKACSGFTHVTARRIAQPPKAAFVTRLQPCRLPGRTARQLPDQSTTLWVESSSTSDPRLRGALPTGDTCTAAERRDGTGAGDRPCWTAILVEPIKTSARLARTKETAAVFGQAHGRKTRGLGSTPRPGPWTPPEHEASSSRTPRIYSLIPV
jgi:hypothetical protein